MSDDPKNPEDKNKNMMNDMFSKNVTEPDPNEIPDDVAFQSADSGVEESPGPAKTETPTAEAAVKPVNNPNIIPINGRPPATTEETTVINPNLDESTRATAAALRKVQSGSPVLSGKDADLVTWNKKMGRIEPKDSESAAILKSMGENADVYCSRVGEIVARPLKYDAETMSMKANETKAVKPIPRAKDIASGGGLSNIIRTTPEDRMTRVTGQDADSEKDKQKKESADRRIKEAMDENVEQKQAQSAKNQQPMTGMGLMAAKLGEGLGKMFAAIGRFLRAAAAAVVGASKKITGMVSDLGSQRMSSRNAQVTASDEMPTVSPKPAGQAAAVGVSGASGAAAELASRMASAQQNVEQASTSVVEDYRANTKKNIENLSNGIGAHEVGSELIKTKEMFRDKMATRSPQDKAKVTRALNSNRENTENLVTGVKEVVSHPDLGFLPAGEKARILNGMQASVSAGVKTDHLSQLTVNNAADDKGVTFTEQANTGVAGAKQAIGEALEQANQQAQIEEMSRDAARQQMHDRSHGQSQADDHRPTPS